MLQFQFPCYYSSLPYSSQIGNHRTPTTNPIPPSQFLQSQILCSAHISQTIEQIIQIQTYTAYYKSHLLSPHIIAHYLQPKHSPMSLQSPANCHRKRAPSTSPALAVCPPPSRQLKLTTIVHPLTGPNPNLNPVVMIPIHRVAPLHYFSPPLATSIISRHKFPRIT